MCKSNSQEISKSYTIQDKSYIIHRFPAGYLDLSAQREAHSVLKIN